MKHATIYGTQDSLDEVYALLEATARQNRFRFEAEGDAGNWSRILLKQKKLLGSGLQVSFSARRLHDEQDDFPEHLNGLLGFVNQIETPHAHAKLHLLNRARAVNCGVGIGSEGLDQVLGMVQLVALALEGFAFLGGAVFVDAEGGTLLDIKGDTELAVPEAQPDQSLRKQRSEAILTAQAIPFLDSLPMVGAEAHTRLRSPLEVTRRLLALALVAVKGETDDDKLVEEVCQRFQAQTFFSPREQAFLAMRPAPEQVRVQFSWQYECVWVLLWALGYLEQLALPRGICDVPAAMGILREAGSFDALLQGATPRSVAEVLDETDLIYRLHWACVDARLKGQPAPGGLEAGVVMERHRALNWLTGYLGQDWDQVSTDT